MSRFFTSCLFLAILMTTASFAQQRLPEPVLHTRVGSASSPAKAPGDTVYVYGGPGTLEGRFETAGGLADPQGWTSVDLTQRDNHWSVEQVAARDFGGYEIALDTPTASLIPGAPFLLGQLGTTVATLGDIDGDGWTDLAANYWNLGGPERAVVVYRGTGGGDVVPDLAYAELPGGLDNAYGQTIAAAGDVNADGFDDFVVANPVALQSSVSLYLGSSTPDVKRDAVLSASAFVQDLGHAMSTAGDVNGDGYDDLLIAGRSATLGDYVLLQLGGAAGFGAGYTLREDASVAGFGTCVAGLGDVNGDGYDDVLVGHPAAASGRGRVYLYLGGFLSTPTPIVFTGAAFSDAMGASIAGPGDVNGDGYDDFVVGVPGHEVNGIPRGAAYLYFGGSTIDPDPAFVLPGIDHNDRYGLSVAALGDLNADGFADYLSAYPLDDGGGPDAGASFVVFGGPSIPELNFEPFDGTMADQQLGARVAAASGFHALGPSMLLGRSTGGASILHAWPTSLPGNHWIRSGLATAPAGWVNASGYGNDWDEVIHLYHDVADPSAATEVRLRFLFEVSVEDLWDTFRVELVAASGVVSLGNFTGTLTNQIFDETTLQTADDYVIDPETGNPAVLVRLRFASDGLGSDEDGLFTSVDGAVAVDHLALWIDGSLASHAGWEPVAPKIVPGDIAFDGFDHGGWAGSQRYFFGDFAKLVSNFLDIDPARDDLSPQWAFLDDGTPAANDPLGLSTGGSTSGSWNYGVPSGAVVNYTGGVGLLSSGIWNEVWSPAIAWDDPLDPGDENYVDAELRAQVYRHLPLDNGLFFYWGVRSWSGSAWSEWDDDNLVFYGPDPEYADVSFSLAGHVPAAAESIQVRLGLRDLHETFSLPGGDATPSPLFDDVAVTKIFQSTASAVTAPGSDVEVELDDVTVTFEGVAGGGTTTLIVQNANPNPLTGFTLATDPARYYEVSTSATWSGDVEVCIHYDDDTLTVPETDLRIRHWQDTASGPAWVDVTSSHDTLTNVICGIANSLSPFVLVAAGTVVSTPPAEAVAAVLHPPHPNPFNPRTKLSFTLPQSARVRLELFDARGRHVKTLASGAFVAGRHALVWDGADDAGRRVASGVYLARLWVDERPAGSTVRLTLVR